MFREIIITHFHPQFNIGLENIKTGWLLANVPVKLSTSTHRGNLVFRMPGSGKRISYKSRKKGSAKKKIIIRQKYEVLPF